MVVVGVYAPRRILQKRGNTTVIACRHMSSLLACAVGPGKNDSDNCGKSQ